jgi:hypothetical protein
VWQPSVATYLYPSESRCGIGFVRRRPGQAIPTPWIGRCLHDVLGGSLGQALSIDQTTAALDNRILYTTSMVGAKAALLAIDELRQSWMGDRSKTNNGGGGLGMIIGRGVRRQLVPGARQSCSDDSIKVPLAGLFPTHNTVLSRHSVALRRRVLRRFVIPSPHEPYPSCVCLALIGARWRQGR